MSAPGKAATLRAWLDGGVLVLLDPRRAGVVVPPRLRGQPQLVLYLGLDFPTPIRDLEVDAAGVRATLSFARTPFHCTLPWSAVYALVRLDGECTTWPADVPPELLPRAAAAGLLPRPALRLVKGGAA